MLATTRLRLKHWADRHSEPFARMHADPEVMADLGGAIEPAASALKLARYKAAQVEFGVARWAVETIDGDFLGYCGVMRRPAHDHPLGPHVEIGWRFMRDAWGQGFATESARAALAEAEPRVGLHNIVSYTSADNARSQRVIEKLGLSRDPSRDFLMPTPSGGWKGLVWSFAVD